jgi:hypothetical protein
MGRRRNGNRREEQRPGRRPTGRRLVSVLRSRGAIVVAVAVLFAAGGGAWWLQRGNGSHAKTAAIVDQLGPTAPDADFIASTTQTLKQAGYAVDYYPGDQVTVEFFRHLAERNYDLLVLRAHSGLTTITNADTGQVTHTRSVSIFTSEPFDASQYQTERNAGRLGRSRLVEDSQEVLGVFGIEPDFVRYSMQGRFNHTLVVMMGCNGVDAPLMARAFLDRGASAVVGWDNFVSAPFTDTVTSHFLDALLTRKIPVQDAVRQVSAQFGRDPQFGGQLQLVTGASGRSAPAPSAAQSTTTAAAADGGGGTVSKR